LSDESIEDAIYDSQFIRSFVGINLGRESAPDATTMLNLLEANGLTRKVLVREGTIVDATLIAALPSTKNKDGKRDPEMHPSKKGNDWHFGMKAHVGVDAAAGLVHTVHRYGRKRRRRDACAAARRRERRARRRRLPGRGKAA
jgi:IS5 family transposase